MQYKVYKVLPSQHYGGSALIAAESAVKANEFIKAFREFDKNNERDS